MRCLPVGLAALFTAVCVDAGVGFAQAIAAHVGASNEMQEIVTGVIIVGTMIVDRLRRR